MKILSINFNTITPFKGQNKSSSQTQPVSFNSKDEALYGYYTHQVEIINRNHPYLENIPNYLKQYLLNNTKGFKIKRVRENYNEQELLNQDFKKLRTNQLIKFATKINLAAGKKLVKGLEQYDKSTLEKAVEFFEKSVEAQLALEHRGFKNENDLYGHKYKALENLAYCYMITDKEDKLDSLVPKHKKETGFQDFIGRYYYWNKNFNMAAKSYHNAVKGLQDPKRKSYAHVNLGDSLLRIEQPKNGIKHLLLGIDYNLYRYNPDAKLTKEALNKLKFATDFLKENDKYLKKDIKNLPAEIQSSDKDKISELLKTYFTPEA